MTSGCILYEPMKIKFCMTIITKSWPIKFVMLMTSISAWSCYLCTHLLKWSKVNVIKNITTLIYKSFKQVPCFPNTTNSQLFGNLFCCQHKTQAHKKVAQVKTTKIHYKCCINDHSLQGDLQMCHCNMDQSGGREWSTTRLEFACKAIFKAHNIILWC